jgi:hypothetical protein
MFHLLSSGAKMLTEVVEVVEIVTTFDIATAPFLCSSPPRQL